MNGMNMNENRPLALPQPAASRGGGDTDIKKYIRILKKRKWLIIFATMLIFAGWTAYVVLYGSTPVYSAVTKLKFEDARDFSAVENRGQPDYRSAAKLLETNRLLGQIVEEFQWNFSVRDDVLKKDDVFTFVNVDRNSDEGDYTLLQKRGKYELLYTNNLLDVQNELLKAFLPGDTVRLKGLEFVLNDEKLKTAEFEKIDFRVIAFEKAMQSLRGSFSYVQERKGPLLEIIANSTSPKMAAMLANTIAQRFVQLTHYSDNASDIREMQTLEEQLSIAKADLDDINLSVQQFQEQHPRVALITADPASPYSEISAKRTLIASRNTQQVELSSLLNRQFAGGSLDEQISNARSLLTFLLGNGVSDASAYNTELLTLENRRIDLTSRFGMNNPEVKQNEAAFTALFPKIKESGQSYLAALERDISEANQQIAINQGRISTLPSLQRQMQELLTEQEQKRSAYQLIGDRFNLAKIKANVEVGVVQILDEAFPPPLVGSTSLIINKALLGLLFGLGLGVGLAFLLEFFDKTVQTSEDLQDRLKLPVLGSIPVINEGDEIPENIRDIKGKRDTKLITLDYSPTLESESYRDLRTKILFMNQNETLTSFLVSSLRPGEGKSLTVSNLAITFAQQKISTLLIDADLRRGVLHNVFGNKKKPGLSDFLISKATMDYDNVNKLIQKTFIPNLYLITTGSPIPNPTEMLGSERMLNLLSILKSRFGMVILDTAPFEASSDSAILANAVNGALLVVRADYTNVDMLGQKIQEYPTIQRKILGVVLNMEKVDSKRQPYQYSYYNY